MFSFKPGPDPDFPYLNETVNYFFSDPKEWDGDIVSIGGNLSPGMLLSAYEQGIFPWYNPEDPLIWQSPDPRCVIFPEKLHISSSMKKIFKNNEYEITFDKDFFGVMTGCKEIFRPNQGGTWLSDYIIESYMEIYKMGWAHSAESWKDGELAGGCYGVLMGKYFVGESMFSRKKNASKAAFLSFAKMLFEKGIEVIDCQVPTDHLQSLGGEPMSRSDFLKLLKKLKVSRF